MLANILIALGIALMAIGLAGLLMRLVHGRPEEEHPPAPPAEG